MITYAYRKAVITVKCFVYFIFQRCYEICWFLHAVPQLHQTGGNPYHSKLPSRVHRSVSRYFRPLISSFYAYFEHFLLGYSLSQSSESNELTPSTLHSRIKSKIISFIFVSSITSVLKLPLTLNFLIFFVNDRALGDWVIESYARSIDNFGLIKKHKTFPWYSIKKHF